MTSVGSGTSLSEPAPLPSSQPAIAPTMHSHHITSTRTVLLVMAMLLASSCPLPAQTITDRPDRKEKTHIAPAYFGPNAFPVPEMLDDAVCRNLEFSLRGDYFMGDYGDHTGSLTATLRIPLFSSRANLVAWMPVVERYSLSPAWIRHAPIAPDTRRHGWTTGTVFLSTDVLLWRERKYRPAIAIRACLRTAAERDMEAARNYDCAGYFFDASLGKEFAMRKGIIKSLRLAASGGFLCWQTGNGRQNDATMYGVKLTARFKHMTVSQDLRGYAGWEHDGDCPMVMKTAINASFNRYTPYLEYQKGLKDYPYQQFSMGLKVSFDILPGKAHSHGQSPLPGAPPQ